MIRAVLGGLVGRSVEWVKGVETAGLQVPRQRGRNGAG
jgi:hypothetical protein